MRTKLIVSLLIMVFLVAISLPTQGWPVFDAANFAKNAAQLVEQVKQTANMVKQLQYQFQELQYQAQNLANLDSTVRSALKSELTTTLNQLISCLNSATAFTYKYGQMQQQWDSTYKDFSLYSGMTGSEYASDAMAILKKTKKAMYDAANTQDLISGVDSDRELLQSLISASNSSSGALQAAQAGNSIAALQIQQLMRLQTIMTASYRAQTLYYQSKLQEEGAARSSSKLKMNKVTPSDYEDSSIFND